MCLVEGSKDLPDDLLKLGRDIDAVIEQKFEAWRAPFVNKGTRSRFSTFLKSPIHKELAAQGKVRPSTLIERLHNDVHGGLPALDYYQQLVQAGSLLHSAKELCIIGHDPLYLTLRFAMSMRFPEGPVRRDGLMAEPFGNQILKIYDLAE
jgi:hypothetical protein